MSLREHFANMFCALFIRGPTSHRDLSQRKHQLSQDHHPSLRLAATMSVLSLITAIIIRVATRDESYLRMSSELIGSGGAGRSSSVAIAASLYHARLGQVAHRNIP
jgi:hypothetical protein